MMTLPIAPTPAPPLAALAHALPKSTLRRDQRRPEELAEENDPPDRVAMQRWLDLNA